MGVVERFKQKLKQLEASINPAIKSTIDANEAVLIRMNTKKQLHRDGKDAEGVKLIPSYAKTTKIIKKKKGQKISNVTLKDSGDFYEGITIETTTTQAIFNTNADYYIWLAKYYNTGAILGLTAENKKEFISKYIEPTIKKNFKSIISK